VTRIIETTDDLTPEWFTEVFRASGDLPADGAVDGVELAPIGAGVIARSQRAVLTYSGSATGPASVVVKYSTDDAGSLGVAKAMRMYATEVAFYRDVAPVVGASCLPKAFLADHDPETDRFVLVMEDLTDSARPGDVLTMLTPDEASAVLAELVRLQAPTWNNAQLEQLPWLSDNSLTVGMFQQFPLGMPAFVKRFEHRLRPDQIELFEVILPNSADWARGWDRPTVVQHGDFRTDNVMFGKTESDPAVRIIDFQTVRLGPPGVDVSYFLGAALSVEDRRASERDLIKEYHERLVAAGVEDFDFDACWQSYREGVLYGVSMFVGMGGAVEQTERADRLMAEQIDRFASMAIDLDSAGAAGLGTAKA
jgi:hypothetical protein